MLLDEISDRVDTLLRNLYDAAFNYDSNFDIEEYPEEYRKYVKNYVEFKRNAAQCIMDYLYDHNITSGNIRAVF